MITRMMIHSVVFTVAIALSAVVLNGAGMLNTSLPNGNWFTFDKGHHDRDFGKRDWGRHGGHDDD